MNDGIFSGLRLIVITSKQLVVDEHVDSISLPSLDGYLGILPGHRHLLLAVGQGTLTYKKGKSEKGVSVQGGYAKIHPDRVHVFTELSDNASQFADKG